MQVIPAIDLKGGRCVRLLRGNPADETVYSDDPVEMATAFREGGIGKLHIVDLDAALGCGENSAVYSSIIQTVGIPVQIGGGMRDMDAIARTLESGVAQVILGTAAVEDSGFLRAALKTFGRERIIVSLDVADGRIAVRGWQSTVKISVSTFLERLAGYGVGRIVYTDVGRDGTLEGVDKEILFRLCAGTEISVTVAGGISCASDIEELAALGNPRIDSVVVGRAFYEGRITIEEMARWRDVD